jgi:hypothetical protein
MRQQISRQWSRLIFVSIILAGTGRAAAGGPVSLADPTRIPIAVWLQVPANAAKYAKIGINCYVGLWEGPNESQLATLEKAAMPLICEPNEEALKPRWNREIVGWLQQDEPDNAQELAGDSGYGPPITPDEMVTRYHAMKNADPSRRPVYLGLGQGVAWDGWFGRGVRSNKPEDYPRYVEAGDIVGFDIYPVTHDQKEVAGKLEYVGRGIDRLVKWTGGKKPVWACIECTRINNVKVKPTPAQVRAEVWMALIHGARGIDYFVHQFKPRFIEAAVLQDPPMCEAITKINAQVEQLAPVLNAPAPEDSAVWEIAGHDKSTIAAITRRAGGATYVFAVGMSSATVDATFHLAGGDGSISVLDENHFITSSGGHWVDTFRGYEVHLYRMGPTGSNE